MSGESLSISQGDKRDARIDEADEWGQRIKGGLTVQSVEALTDQDVRQGDSTILYTTDELSQPTLGQMMTGECRDSFIDDGFNDQETMFVRIPLGRFKLAPKAVSPCLGLT